jgi:pimeloyl-ACP methyl ester carboxylesterase
VATDTARIADALGIGRFATTGQSGGGPFSLACAAVLGERVTRVGVTSGAAPFDRVPGLPDVLDENDTAAVALLPDQEAAARQFAVGFEPFRSLGQQDDAAIIAGFQQLGSPRDSMLLDDPRLAAALAAATRISLVQGCEGAGWDNVAWVGPWDIDLDDVRQPVHLWYGGEDTFCPVVCGRWLEEHLAAATLVVREGDGHFGVVEHHEEVLATLTGG